MVAEILKTKLRAVDADCEAIVSFEIRKLFSQAWYDGSRFRVPSFDEAATLWLGLIANKEREFIKEINRVMKDPAVVLSKTDSVNIHPFIEEIFSEDRHVEKMRTFFEGLDRKAASYGAKFDLQARHLQIQEAGYRSAATNALRRARENVFTEIKLIGISKRPKYITDINSALHFLLAHKLKAILFFILWAIWAWAPKPSLADALFWFRQP